jgi:hypothetical protein
LDEFAAAFGFLEESAGNYFAGKFGLVGSYVSAKREGHRYFDDERARTALLLYSLLEKHGDCVLPVLSIISQGNDLNETTFSEAIARSVLAKAERWSGSALPRNQAFQFAETRYGEYVAEWAPDSARIASQPTRVRQRPIKPLEEKTKRGYLQRTVRYLTDLAVLARRAGSWQLTGSGNAMVSCGTSLGIALPSAIPELPPSLEVVHDAFSIDEARYDEIFQPRVDHGILERLVASFIFPETPVSVWRESERPSQNLIGEYQNVVSELSENLTGAARLDAVRLALYIFSIGIGSPMTLASEESAERLNENAAVQIGLSDPHRFMLGHARSGRRFWSVTLLRR